MSFDKINVTIKEQGIHKQLDYDLTPKLNLHGKGNLLFERIIIMLINDVVYD